MNPRSTGILFLVALAVVGGVWWYENVHKAEVEEAEAESRELFPEIEEPDVLFVALETRDGREVRLERSDGVWRLRQPLDFPTDRTTVDGLVAALVETRSAGVIDSPQDPDVYGLGEDATHVRFGTAEGEFGLRVGDKTPVGGNHYAAREGGQGEEAVYTIPSFRASALRRSLSDLREKRVLRFDRDAIERIELSWPGGGVQLERGGEAGGEWRVTAPVEDAADADTVDALLADLSFLRAEGFEDAPPADPEVGLDRPVFEARLVTSAEGDDAAPRIFHLKVGSETGDGQQRHVRGREHSLYLVPEERIRDLPQDLAAYRFKELARFDAGEAASLEIAFQDPETGAHVVLAERDEDGWASSPETMAPGKAARMVAELSTLRGNDIVADALGTDEQARLGLEPPRVRFRVRGAGEAGAEGPVLAEVLLGVADADRGIVARSGDRDRIYRIDYALGEHLPLNAEAFRNRFLSGEDAPEAGGDGLQTPSP